MILVCFGTRPEYIKISPVLQAMNGHMPYRTLFTGQHDDLVDADSDIRLQILPGPNRMNQTIQACLSIAPESLNDITHVMVQGDTASAFGMALCAYNYGIPIIHLEAGLRTYDLANPFPEEGYRQAIARLAMLHLCPTNQNAQQLRNERVQGDIRVVGNTGLDHLPHIAPIDGNTVLVTLHRQENHADMAHWFNAINDVAKHHPQFQFEFPMHPSPNVMVHRPLLTHVHSISPMAYADMIQKVAHCKCIITDSGGLQEEASFFNKPVIVCRKTTERTESLTTHSVLCPTPNQLLTQFNAALSTPPTGGNCPYGDGYSAARVVSVLTEYSILKEYHNR
jgi:UDP-N-acetylglucosamine 2-epimerase (non-hydrolysing)